MMGSRWAAVVLVAAATGAAAAPAQAGRLLVMDTNGRVHARADRFLPARAPAAAATTPRDGGRSAPSARRGATARAAATKPGTRTTRRALRALRDREAIDEATYDRALRDDRRARQLRRRLEGARHVAMAGVLADLDGIAARRQLLASRLPALLATLEANIRWWTTGPLLAPGQRVAFAGSDLVWQHYPGHGIQLQWLATFGKANALWKERRNTRFEDLLAESLALAGRRGGGVAFEYLFAFDGGAPPWVSGLAQGTALTAFSRGSTRLHDPAWLEAARSALGIFRTPPPTGVAQPTPDGTHYLQYSFAPRLHILNGFIQSLNGLFDYATTADDAEARALFDAGAAEARAELPDYDTGGWSRYSNFSDSSLSYHKLLRDFLLGLCKRLQRHDLDPQPFCAYGYRFAVDLTTPPELSFASSRARLRARRRARVVVRVDKPARLTLTIRRGSFARSITASVSSGRHVLTWRPPRAGSYDYELSATDLAGNSASARSAARVRRR